MQLSNPSLLQTGIFINNQWLPAANGHTFRVENPANGSLVAEVANAGEPETLQAIEAAEQAFASWSTRPAKERSNMLRQWFNLIIANTNDLALLMTTEQGKPLSESKGEVVYGASFIEWFAEEARRVYGDVVPSPDPHKRIITLKQPIGVVAAITPWNFPIAMITRKIGPALAAGCTVVVKPASLTPLCALALAELASSAGLPPGVLNVLPTTQSASVGKILTTHPMVSKVSFTGSTQTGKILMEQAASTIKKISLELGGNAPLLVMNDADIQKAVAGAIASKYRNAGQTCVCVNRIYVQSDIYHRFMDAYTPAVQALKVGEGTRSDVQIGPLINADAVKKVQKLLSDATDKGAVITTGGRLDPQGGLFFQPTIIENCNSSMQLSQEEIFGPVSAIYRFTTDDEAVALANNTIFGLAAYFFSENISRCLHLAERLQYGMVGINEGLISYTEAPFGGIKQSGFGREGSKYGIDDYVFVKYLCIGGL